MLREFLFLGMTSYLKKLALFPPQIIEPPEANLQMVVVIPCYDEPQLIRSLESLKKSKLPKCGVEVIVVINGSENDSAAIRQTNADTFEKAKAWRLVNSSPKLKFSILFHPNLPAKKAGVGLARKIGMDEAVYRLEVVGSSKGVIVCFDADSLCQTNYFQEIEAYFLAYPKTKACSIYFEHPIAGEEYASEVYQAIIQYELHLRYYNNAKRFTGFPFAFETIGSSMAVRCDAYQQQGGMNKRKAGEDFYFLNKFMPLGNFAEIKTTTVIPSPRKSHRVPFGTGKAIAEMVDEHRLSTTYAPQIFVDLKLFFEKVPDLFSMAEVEIERMLSELPSSVKTFLEKQNFLSKLAEIRANTTNLATFENRFFRWFNGFLMMKYVHHSRDEFYPNVSGESAAIWLLNNHFKYNLSEGTTAAELLKKLREEDKK